MEWMIIVTWLARIILVLLVGMSVYAVSIILERKEFFKKNTLGGQHNDILNKVEKGEIGSIKSMLSSKPFDAQVLMAFENSSLEYVSVCLLKI